MSDETQSHELEMSRCECCMTSVTEGMQTPQGFFCSQICHETELSCERIVLDALKAGSGATAFPGTANAYTETVIFGAHHGHGFAAENANHIKDILHGRDAAIVGRDNAKNGPDRLVDGAHIQSKYCRTGGTCI